MRMDAFMLLLRPCHKGKLPMIVLYIWTMFCILTRSIRRTTASPLTITAERNVYQVNSSVQLNCTLDQPSQMVNTSNISWIYNGAPIREPQAKINVLDPTTSLLLLDEVQIADSGIYGCRLNDDPWRTLVNWTIQVGVPPAKATNLHCSSHDFIRINCQWNNGPKTNLETSHRLECRKQHTLNWQVCNATVCCPYPDKIDLRVISTNALGRNESTRVRFDKPEDTVLNPPRLPDKGVTPLSNSSLLVRWRPPKDYENYPGAKKLHLIYQLMWRFKNESGVWHTWSKMVDVNIFSDMDLTHPSWTISGLRKPYGLYHVSLKVKGPDGNTFSNSSNVVSARTSEAAPESGVHLNPICEGVNRLKDGKTMDAQISWEPFPEAKMNGILLDYVININGSLYTVPPNITKYSKSGLDSNKHYEISIVARNSVGNSDEDFCGIPPMPTAPVNSIPLVMGIVGATFAFTVCSVILFCAWQRVKRSMVHFPDIRFSHHIHTDNFYTFGNLHRYPPREKESYDELITHNLFVDLTSESDSCATCCNGVMADGFALEKDLSKEPILEPLENHRKHPLLSARRTNSLVNENYSKGPMEQEALLSASPVSPNSEIEKCGPSGDYSHHYGGWKDSALSIKSGGSYMHLRDADASNDENTTDGYLVPDIKGGHRGSIDKLADAHETRQGLMVQDSAGAYDLDRLLQLDDGCPYTQIGAAESESLTLEGLQPSSEVSVVARKPILPSDNVCNTSYTDMGGKASGEKIERPHGQKVTEGGLDPIGRDKSRNVKPTISGSDPPSDEELEEISTNNDLRSNTCVGNYVQHGIFLAPSPQQQFSRSGSPSNPCNSSIAPQSECKTSDSDPHCHPSFPTQPKQMEKDSDPDLGAACDRSDSGSLNEVDPYVVSMHTRSESVEPLVIPSGQDTTALQHSGENHPTDDNEDSAGSPQDGCSLNEQTPLLSSGGDTSGHSSLSGEEDFLSHEATAGSQSATSSSSLNGEHAYVTVGQLPSPITGSGDSKRENRFVHEESQVTQDEHAYPQTVSTASPDELNTNISACGENEAGKVDYIDPGEIARLSAPQAVNTLSSESFDSITDTGPDKTRDSGYVTHEDLANMTLSPTVCNS